VLDDEYGPHVPKGCTPSLCRGVATINHNASSFTLNCEFYAMAQFSRFLSPGALKLRTTLLDKSGGSCISGTALTNPKDGSLVTVVHNFCAAPQNVAVLFADLHVEMVLPVGVSSIFYKPAARYDNN